MYDVIVFKRLSWDRPQTLTFWQLAMSSFNSLIELSQSSALFTHFTCKLLSRQSIVVFRSSFLVFAYPAVSYLPAVRIERPKICGLCGGWEEAATGTSFFLSFWRLVSDILPAPMTLMIESQRTVSRRL